MPEKRIIMKKYELIVETLNKEQDRLLNLQAFLLKQGNVVEATTAFRMACKVEAILWQLKDVHEYENPDFITDLLFKTLKKETK